MAPVAALCDQAALPVLEQAPPAGAARQMPPLRIGLVVDSRLQPRWLVKAFTALAGAAFARVEVIADLGGEPGKPPALWRMYCSLDQRAFGKGDDPTALCDLAAAVTHRRYVQGVDALASLGLDVVFALGNVRSADIAPYARYGVWRFGFGADGSAPLEAAGLADRELDPPVAASGLLATLPGEDDERLLCQSWARTFPISVSRSRRGLLPKTSDFARLALKRLHESGPGWIASCARAPARPRSALQNAGGYLRHLAGVGPYVAARSLQSLACVDQWFIACRFGNPHVLSADAIGQLRGFSYLMPPKDRFWADPFPLEQDGRHYIFLEELPFDTGRGHISVTEVDCAGRWSKPVPVLERGYHLSYPQLTRHRGQLYMVPETGKNGTVEVYRCVSFPDRWKLEKVLLEDVCAADATFHRGEDGRWWMFVSLFPKESRFVEGGDELHIYYADDFLGPWKPHPRNPVNCDVRNARPAGHLYTRNGVLYRPAQVGVPLYGSGMAINQVLRLTPTEYIEKEVERIRPRAKGLLGIHTLNSTGRFTVVDGFTRTLKV